jgi:hypothetical protein
MEFAQRCFVARVDRCGFHRLSRISLRSIQATGRGYSLKLAEARCVAAPGLPIAYQPACKPGSVWRQPRRTDARRPFLWNAGCPALQATYPDGRIRTSILERRRRLRSDPLHAVPMWFCSRWGLPSRWRCRQRGALLPHRFTLAARPLPFLPRKRGRAARRGCGGLFSVALSLGSPPPDVIRHRMSMEPGLSSPR